MAQDIFQQHEQRRKRRNMRVVRLIIVNWIAGALLGLVLAGLVVWFDIAGVGRLILKSDPMWPALALLCGGFMITFSSQVAGTAIMLIPREETPPDDPPGGKREPVPALVRAKAGVRQL
ncbi:MAG: hypothetical protein AB7F96_12780 [Beijerinckiaceae bacterium]